MKRYYCPTCGCVRDFWATPMVDCHHNVRQPMPPTPTPPSEFVPIPSWHPLVEGELPNGSPA